MKKNILFLLLIFIARANAQTLEPSEDKSLLNIKVTNFSGKILPNETVVFVGKKDLKKYTVVTNTTGMAKILLPEGQIYDIQYRDFMEQQDYSSIEVPNKPGAFTFDLTIKFEPSKTYTLKNVHYETGKATITPDSYPSLNELADALKAKPTLVIEIAGHTDNVGNYESNLKLSQDRANSVRSYLISKGISVDRVSAKGYADSQPVASNSTDEGKAKNRRTEVRIVKE